ncbi:MAG: rod shape-determining protein MreD [Bacteroidales bacterium]|nr:rod shape-determining protein MreD [Bacteroidales bacterium]
MNNVVANILRFFVLLLVQVAICQHISLFGYMTPALFLLALYLLPLEMPLSLQYVIGFATGFVTDAFAHTLGVSSFACTLLMFFRPYIVRMLNGANNVKFENIDRPVPGVKDFRWVFLYTLTLTSIYEVVAVLLETMTFKNFGHTLLVIVGNTLFSVFVILCIEYIFHSRVKK